MVRNMKILQNINVKDIASEGMLHYLKDVSVQELLTAALLLEEKMILFNFFYYDKSILPPFST